MANIVDIPVTKETVSDDSYKVTSLYFADGDPVKKGDIIGTFETSKTDIDVEAPVTGHVFYNFKLGSTVAVGSVFACISPSGSLPPDYFNEKTSLDTAAASGSTDIRISKLAAKLIREHNIDITVFRGKTILEKKDVEDFLKAGTLTTVQEKESNELPRSARVIIIGGGNHSKVCIDILRQVHTFDIAGIVYTKTKPSSPLMGCEFIGGLNDLEDIYKNIATNAVIGIGGLENPKERSELYERLKLIGFSVPNLIHPKSIVEPSVSLGEGNQIFGGANIGSFSRIGNNCILNSNSVISHDCVLGDNVHITPGAILAGTVRVGSNSIIGMGVTVYYNCTIGSNVIINNGHNIFKDVPDHSIIR